MKFKPLNDRILLYPIKQKETTQSGIHIPESVQGLSIEGRVVAVGPGYRDADGKRVTLDVKVDDKVLYARYTGTELKVEGMPHILVKEDDILGIIES